MPRRSRSWPLRGAALSIAVVLLGCAGSRDQPTAPAAPSSPGTASPPGAPASAAPATGELAEVSIPPLHPSVDDYGTAQLELRSPTGGVEPLGVLVAETADERQHGLMEVEELPGRVGMLFVFDEPRELSFWMRNTLVPLDLAAISSSGEITDIVAMEPCPPDEDCPRYRPEGEAIAALETAQGWLAEVGVEPGWTVCVDDVGALDALSCDPEE